MLLAELKTQDEKAAFMGLAYLVAKADGSLGYAEKALIDLYLAELAAKPEEFPLRPAPLVKLCGCFSGRHVKGVVFANLLQLAFVDGYDNEAKRSILAVLQDELAVGAEERERWEDGFRVLQGSFFPQYND